MCGISGWIGPPNRDAANRMRAAIRHRGPDDQGAYEDRDVTLLHERLSIIDIASGHQPMTNEDGRLKIIFNGEIYNYRELRERLLASGHRLITNSDTEVILHLYEEMGARCPEKLIGMFSFAIWDAKERTLFIARDRLGVKPLFYTQTATHFIFASELKALLAHPEVAHELDPEGLDHYLTLMYVPAPRTIIKNIFKLPPGHTLTLRDGKLTVQPYWTIPDAADIDNNSSIEQVAGELSDLLLEAVRCRLISEVPLGAYLSGGLDSSMIVALMSRASATPVNTFSVGFEEQGFDERPFSRKVAETFATNHHELVVRHHSVGELSRIIRLLDEPVADSAAIPTYFMAELTKPHVTVVLTGEGADELFAGYSHYKLLTMADQLSAFSPGAAIRWAGRAFGPGRASRAMEYASRLRDRAGAYLALKSVFTDSEKQNLYSEYSKASCRNISPAETIIRKFLTAQDGPYLNQLLRLDLSTWLPDDLLVKVDRMTMAHGVEARVPYLDHRVVEKVMRMPPEWKLHHLVGKRILRNIAGNILPPQIVDRKKKGFAVPVGEWAADEMRPLVQELLGPESVRKRGLFNPQYVSRLTNRSRFGMFERRQLWTLLCLELWCREFLSEP